jgi:glycosyltransferase involved in cell wall biosynthesis
MPVVAVGATEAYEAVPRECGIVSTHLERLVDGARGLLDDPERARVMGKHAREYALARYGLGRFLVEWDQVFEEVTT